MHAWYFTFEFPPEFGGGLSTYMKHVTDMHATRPETSAVIFTLSPWQSGLMSLSNPHRNVTLVSLNPYRTGEAEMLGHWVNIARMFERTADLVMAQIETGTLSLHRPDFLEFADGFGIGAIAIQQKLCLNSRFSEIPIIINAHTPTAFIDRLNQNTLYQLPNYWTWQMELQALVGADLVIAPSRAILELIDNELKLRGTALEHTAVLHNPFVPAETGPEDSGAPAARDHFYMASRLTHWKGVESAILAMKQIWDAGQDIPFLIYGEDTFHAPARAQYSDYLKTKYKRQFERGLIQFLGKQPRHLIRERARTAYAQLHPSHFDNFPYSLLEAMDEGVLCIAGTNGGIREIAPEGRGLVLTDVEDPVQFGEALRRALEISPEERAAHVSCARQNIRQFCDPRSYLDRKAALISEVCGRNRRAVAAGDANRGHLFPFLSPAASDCIFRAPPPKRREPGLSIVIPYFNMARFIDDTLTSVRRATFRDVEIIIVNDGSTDPESCEKLMTLHQSHDLTGEQLRIINVPNGGVARARNTGVEAAHAPLVTLLDSDDMISARYYEKAIRILRHYDNVSFVGSWIEDFNAEGRIRYWATWNAEPPLQLLMNQTNCQSLVYKRDAYLRHGRHDPDLKMFLDDWDGVISLIAAGHRGVMIPEPLFEYRIRSDSIFRATHNLWDLNFEKITQKHRKLYNQWGADIAAFLNANGPNRFYHIAGKESGLRQ